MRSRIGRRRPGRDCDVMLRGAVLYGCLVLSSAVAAYAEEAAAAPDRPVEELERYFRGLRAEDQPLAILADDGEKFGAWPGTYEHCWGAGNWIEECFRALAHNANWLTTVTPSQWLEREPPRGRIYVPTASYVEMSETEYMVRGLGYLGSVEDIEKVVLTTTATGTPVVTARTKTTVGSPASDSMTVFFEPMRSSIKPNSAAPIPAVTFSVRMAVSRYQAGVRSASPRVCATRWRA